MAGAVVFLVLLSCFLLVARGGTGRKMLDGRVRCACADGNLSVDRYGGRRGSQLGLNPSGWSQTTLLLLFFKHENTRCVL